MSDFYSSWATPPYGGAAYRLHLVLNLGVQNVGANTSPMSWYLYLEKDRSWPGFSGYSASYSCTIDSTSRGSASGSIPSSDWTGTSKWTLGSGSFTVTHDPDGTKINMPVAAVYAGANTGWAIGTVSISSTLTLPTIPRATTPTVSPTSGNTAATYTISHTPASSGFYHDVAYSLDGGASYTDIQTDIIGTDTSTDWTPAHSLLPNSTSGTAIIRLVTKDGSGGTVIGTKYVNLPLTVPSSVKPTISSVAWEDSQVSSPDMPTLMGGAGRFVQRWSKLKPTATSAGASGSTITSCVITQNGQATPSGSAFSNAVALSGSVPYSAVATDSRSVNSDTYVNTVAVTAYNFPNLPTPLVTRTSDSGGTTPSPTGEYIAITPSASVSSLIFGGSEKNLLEWRVRIKELGGSYTTVQDWTAATVSGNTWTTKYVAGGGYLSSNEYVVEVSIRDLFGKNGYNSAQTVVALEIGVPSESVFMDWDGVDGLGLGGYRRYGMLDVHGDIYQGGYQVVDLSTIATTSDAGIVPLSSDAQAIAGTDTDHALTPSNLAAKTATAAEILAGVLATKFATPANLKVNVLDRITVLESRPAVRGVVPSSVVVGSGSATVSSDGAAFGVGVSSMSLLSVFDGLGSDLYKVYCDVTAVGGTVSGAYFRLRAAGSNSATNYNYAYRLKTDWGSTFAPGGSTVGVGFMYVLPGTPSGFIHAHSEYLLARPNKATMTNALGRTSHRYSGLQGWEEDSDHALTNAYPDFSLVVVGGGTLDCMVKVVKVA